MTVPHCCLARVALGRKKYRVMPQEWLNGWNNTGKLVRSHQRVWVRKRESRNKSWATLWAQAGKQRGWKPQYSFNVDSCKAPVTLSPTEELQPMLVLEHLKGTLTFTQNTWKFLRVCADFYVLCLPKYSCMHLNTPVKYLLWLYFYQDHPLPTVKMSLRNQHWFVFIKPQFGQ